MQARLIPNTPNTRYLIPRLASISNAQVSSFTSNVPFIDTRARISDLNVAMRFLCSAPVVWTLNSVDFIALQDMYRRYNLESEQEAVNA